MQALNFKPTLLRISGRDRLKWLHNFTTNEIRQLQDGDWCETFITDSKGKTFSHGIVLHNENDYYFLAPQVGQAERLIQHLDRYIISERVDLSDASADFVWRYLKADAFRLSQVLGVQLPEVASDLQPLVSWQLLDDGQVSSVIVRSFMLPPEYALVACQPERILPELQVVDSEDEIKRLASQSRFPWFGIDFNETNLPQEVDRQVQTISFKKGCYLGQETIARLDALGQVQKKLFPVTLSGKTELAVPCEILSGGEVAGTLTSCFSQTSDDTAHGFATLKRKYFEATGLQLADGTEIKI